MTHGNVRRATIADIVDVHTAEDVRVSRPACRRVREDRMYLISELHDQYSERCLESREKSAAGDR